jgi:hypothetical protein
VPAASVAIVITVVTIGLLCVLSGGRLAAGAFDPVTVPAGLAMASVLLLVGVPALLVAGVTRFGEPDEAEWTDDAPGVVAEDAAEDDSAAEAEPAKPRTVAELVALREQQAVAAAAAAAAAESAEEVVDESESEEPEAVADAEPADTDAGNVVSIDRKRRRT